MKTAGLVGGTSWVSTADYYRYINEETNKILGGNQFARCILYSINFGDVLDCIDRDDDEGVYQLLRDAAQKVIRGGAEGILLCANTMHKFADRLKEEISVPIIHIAEATAKAIKEKGLSKAGLLGTKFTMELDFYKIKLKEAGIETLVPGPRDRDFIHRTIMTEFIREEFKPETKKEYLRIMQDLKDKGAQGIILGCTEIPLIIKENDFDLPLFDTTWIHSRAAVEFAVENSK